MGTDRAKRYTSWRKQLSSTVLCTIILSCNKLELHLFRSYRSFNQISTIMKKKVSIICAILLVSIVQSFSQEEVHSLTFKITVADTLESYFKPEGRLFIFLTTNPNGQPAAKIWPNSSYTGNNFLFAKNYLFWNHYCPTKII